MTRIFRKNSFFRRALAVSVLIVILILCRNLYNIYQIHRQETQLLEERERLLEEKEQQCKDLMLEKTVLHKTILDMFDSTEDCLEYELTEEIMKTLYDTKGVIVGGHRNLINKLLKYLPQWTVIEVDRGVKNNWGALRAATLIIMNTEYISHGLYNQAMGNINEKKNIIFNRKNNIEKILREIYIKVSA